MEYILISLFGGGIADWEDISKTYYDWNEIFDRAGIQYQFEDIDINDLYQIILEIALDELSTAMQNYKGETSEEFKSCAKDISNYFETYPNCLATHLSFIGEEELGEEIQDKMADEISKIEDKIGFTYIDF